MKLFCKKLILGTCISLSIFVSSCKKENSTTNNNCPGTTCQNGGTVTGSGSSCACLCTSGYSGTHCETLTRDAMLGTFVTMGDDGAGHTLSNVIVTVSAGSGGITALNVSVNGVTMSATASSVAGFPIFNIASQVKGGATYSGSGGVVVGMLSLQYSKLVSGTTTTYSLSGPRQ